MLFVVKSYKAKKCNNGADHSLCLVSFVFLCNWKTIYRVQIFVRIEKKKKGTTETNTNIKHQRIYLWENYLKLPSFSSHTAWQNCPKKKRFLTNLTVFYHDNIAEQIILDRLETVARDSNMCHTMVSSIGKRKKTHWLTFVIQTGSRSSHEDIFFPSKWSLYDTSVLNLWRHFSVCSELGEKLTSNIW